MSKEIFPTIQHAIIKVVGIFDYTKQFQNEALARLGYKLMPISKMGRSEDRTQFYRDKYYKEFNELLLIRGTDKSVKSFQAEFKLDLNFKKKKFNGELLREMNPKLTKSELHLFENGIGIFSLSIDASHEQPDFPYYSDLLFMLKSFSSDEEKSGLQFHSWISKHVLGGVLLRSDNVKFTVESDEYSGSKFKIYSSFSVNETEVNSEYNREHLLYEIGTGSMLGCVKSNSYLTPSIEYYSELTEFRVSAFQSWTGLALLDSYTAIGSNLITNPDGSVNGDAFVTQDRIYFSIYLFNLYIKYNVFRFNSKFKEDAVKYKSRFEDFINDYNYSHISFDFLPNLIYSKMRAALGIENEIKQFEKRLNSLAANIQEEQEKRQAALLGIISVISSISAIEPIFETSEQVKEYTGMESNLFYALLSIVVIAIAIPILSYLFPHIAKKVWKKLNLYFKND
jgi:hypothetical protein